MGWDDEDNGATSVVPAKLDEATLAQKAHVQEFINWCRSLGPEQQGYVIGHLRGECNTSSLLADMIAGDGDETQFPLCLLGDAFVVRTMEFRARFELGVLAEQGVDVPERLKQAVSA